MLSTFLFTALLAPTAEPKADNQTKADEAIHRYLVAETRKLSARFMDCAKTKAEWEAKRPKLKEQFLDMLGLWPLPERTPLKATVTGTLERGDVAIEKLHYQSRPGLYVTANYYRPKALPKDKKLPAIIYFCGHTGRGRDGNKTAFQDHGLWFANNGYVCLMVDTLQLGEVAGKHHGTYNLNRFWWQCRGYTPAGTECWNAIRGIDYLCTRPEVDADRIGATGISGGGATTCWISAADDRVKVAVPVSGMSDLESYVSNRVINGHCDCMFMVNTYQWEWTTLLALHAPKPLLFANSDNDGIFPMDGNRRIIARLRQCYEMLGAKDNVEEYVSKGGHDYRPDLRVAVFGFINRHLKNDSAPVTDAKFEMIEGEEILRVFPEDKDLPRDSINDKVDELFIPIANPKLPEKKEDFPAWKAGLLKQLRENSFRTLPEKVPSEKELRTLNRDFSPEEQLLEFKGDKTLVVLNSHELVKPLWLALDEYFPNDTVRPLLSTRGASDDAWTRKNPPNTIERSHALLGRTVAAGRVRDVAATLVAYSEGKKPAGHVRIFGRGQAGIIAAYAVLLVPGAVDEVVILDPPVSHSDGPYFLNVQRVLDIPDALGLLAPDVKLTLIGANDKAFDKTAAIYKLAGVEGKFTRK